MMTTCYLSFCMDFKRIFFTARTEPFLRLMPHTDKDTEEKRETGLWTPESLIWIRALQRPLETERSESFFNYWMALLSRIAHSGPRSSWSGRKYVAVPTVQCSINGTPLGAVNCVQETTFRQTPPLSFSFDHEAGPGHTADSNALMCWPACSKHPHWTRFTNKLYIHTGRLERTGISKFIYLFSSPSGVRSSKLRQTTPQHILKPNTADSSSLWKLKTAWILSSSLCCAFLPTNRPAWQESTISGQPFCGLRPGSRW